MLDIKPWTGDPISQPGIYANVPMDRYHASDFCVEPSISSGGLRKIWNESCAHYWIRSPYNPKRLEDEDESAALRFGRALHDLLFSEKDWRENYVTPPELLGGEPWSPYKKVCKIWVDQRKAEGKTVLKDDEKERLIGIGEALKKNEYVSKGALKGGIELSIVWKDKETGIWLKSRPDVMPLSDMVFVDLKKTARIGFNDIARTIATYGYHQQGALVAEGCEQVLSRKIEAFHLLFVEDKPPYSTVMVRLKDHDLIRGIKANRLALRKFAHGLKTGQWPGPHDERQMSGDVYAELPKWAQDDIDWRLKAEGV